MTVKSSMRQIRVFQSLSGVTQRPEEPIMMLSDVSAERTFRSNLLKQKASLHVLNMCLGTKEGVSDYEYLG